MPFSNTIPVCVTRPPILETVTGPDLDAQHAHSHISEGPGEPQTRTAAFFDLDKTVIAKSSTLAFSKPFFEPGTAQPAGGAEVQLRPVPVPDVGRRPRPDGPDAVLRDEHVRRLGRRTGQVDRRRNAARNRRPAGIRRGSGADRRPQAVRPRRGDRLGLRRGDRRADRPRARRDPRHGDPDGRRGRQVHRRGRVLLLRRRQGRMPFASWPPGRVTPSSTATRIRTRSPTCRCSRRSAIRLW